MNKTWIAVLVGAVLISVAGLGIQHIAANPDEAQLTSAEIRDMVERQYPGEITKLELEREHGKLVYDVEIKGPEGEYELKIDASTGDIVKLEEKPYKNVVKGDSDGQRASKDPDAQASPNDQKKTKQTKDNASSEKPRISIDEATEIALHKFPGTIDEVKLEREDGLPVYEVEIETDKGEVEVEVDAYTGEIVMISWDD